MNQATEAWRKGFSLKHKRAPRVLHIGNIANNAYSNAKILNAAGLDCDVVCYDYYHVMGCPEWEDADFSGEIENDFRPAWCDVELNGFQRPSWFVQGPLDLCIDYLLAKRGGDAKAASWFWHLLMIANLTHRPVGFWQHVRGWYASGLIALASYLGRVNRVSRASPSAAFARFLSVARGCPGFLSIPFASLMMVAWAGLRVAVSIAATLARIGGSSSKRSSQEIASRFSERCGALADWWRHDFPERSDPLQREDLEPHRSQFDRWCQLLAHYDFVIGYSTDGVLPLIAGQPYFAFEHGTIREIPYQRTSQGRKAAITYRRAEHVFVTNFDCLGSAERLAPGRFTLLNHPYDEDHAIGATGWQEIRVELRSTLDCDVVCFFPTRHDWVEGTGYADKANDVFLLAVADLRHRGVRIGVVCCDWGANVAQSKALLAAAGLDSQVRWVRPMAMVRFERMALACDLVVDQFKLGAFGGIVFKAMAVGAPILTYLDESRLLKQYQEMPPVINCATRQVIVEKLGQLVRAPATLVELGTASRAWIKKYHGKDETVDLQIEQFRQMIAKRFPAER